jgi:hypothetical protein
LAFKHMARRRRRRRRIAKTNMYYICLYQTTLFLLARATRLGLPRFFFLRIKCLFIQRLFTCEGQHLDIIHFQKRYAIIVLIIHFQEQYFGHNTGLPGIKWPTFWVAWLLQAPSVGHPISCALQFLWIKLGIIAIHYIS